VSSRSDTRAIAGWRCLLIVVAAMVATCTSAGAHHHASNDGPTIGVAIPAIAHGEMSVVARYRAEILDLAARQPRTDLTLRRLAGFVSLQRFACFWGLVPGTLSDETSPFNECAHAYLAGTRALLAHMVAMPGDASAARELDARIEADLSRDPNHGALCSNSSQTFDSGVVIGPDWQLAPTHLPTVLSFLVLVIMTIAGVSAISRRLASTQDCLPKVG
jgi:hypothetical protein